ncbi:MAG: hypothetical protein AAF581_10825 [Planctomycetota bacterium]
MVTTTRMLSLLAAVLCFAPLAAPAQETALPEADAILDRVVEAMGGAAAHQKIRSRVMDQDMTIAAHGMNLKSSVHQEQGNVRQSVGIPGQGMQEFGSNNGLVWSSDPMMGPRILEGAEREFFLRSTRLYPYMHAKADYTGRTVVAMEKVNDRDCYKLELKPKAGSPEHWFIDKETHQIARMVMTYTGPLGTLPIKIDLSDYRPIDGIQYAHATALDQAGTAIQMSLAKVSHNAEIDPAKFALPAAIQKLVDKKKKKEALRPQEEKPAEKPEEKPAEQPAGGGR